MISNVEQIQGSHTMFFTVSPLLCFMFRIRLCRYFGSFPLFHAFPPHSALQGFPFSPEWTTETCRIRYASASVQLPPQNSASGSESESESILHHPLVRHLNIKSFSNSKIVQSCRQVELFWFMAHCIRQIQNAFTNTRGPQVAAGAVSPLLPFHCPRLLITLHSSASEIQDSTPTDWTTKSCSHFGRRGTSGQEKVSPTCHYLEIREQSPLNWLRNSPDRLCWPKAKAMKMIS